MRVARGGYLPCIWPGIVTRIIRGRLFTVYMASDGYLGSARGTRVSERETERAKANICRRE